MIRHSKLNYEQMYIDHGYIELHIPAKKKFNSKTREVTYDFAMEANYCKDYMFKCFFVNNCLICLERNSQ